MNYIQANRDPNVQIKEIAKHMIHVRLTKVAFDEKDPEGTRSESHTIQVFTPKEFEKMEAQKDPKKTAHPFDWVLVAGFRKAFVVHDGRSVPKEEEKKDEVTDALNEVIKDEVKAAVKKERAKRNIRQNLNKAK